MAADQIQKRAADAEQLAADWRACEKAAAAFDEETNTGGDGAAAEENALRNIDAKRVAALAELADRPALAGRAAAGAIQRRKRSLADRAAGQMLFALALRDDDDGPDAGAVVPVSRRRAPFCWRKRDVAAAATAAAALKASPATRASRTPGPTRSWHVFVRAATRATAPAVPSSVPSPPPRRWRLALVNSSRDRFSGRRFG